MHNFTTHHLYTVLCVHHPKSREWVSFLSLNIRPGFRDLWISWQGSMVSQMKTELVLGKDSLHFLKLLYPFLFPPSFSTCLFALLLSPLSFPCSPFPLFLDLPILSLNTWETQSANTDCLCIARLEDVGHMVKEPVITGWRERRLKRLVRVVGDVGYGRIHKERKV